MRARLAVLAIVAATLCTPGTPAPCTVVPMVFFDFMKSNLSPPALQVIGEGARITGEIHSTHVLITGYCDSAEIARGCTALALRRATAVKAELVRLGLDQGTIEIRGSEELLVPTGPNIREPQNRRASFDWI